MKTEVKLPDKRSELLKLALSNLELIEEDPFYEVKMAIWHDRNFENEKCQVCFAGSVMAKTLDAPFREYVCPDTFNYETMAKLYWLDRVRTGYVDCLSPIYPFPTYLHSYKESPEGFKLWVRTVIEQLEKEGK